MRTFWNYDRTLRTLQEWEPNCWAQVTCPNEDDEKFLMEELKVPDYFLDDIRDKDERSRYEFDDGWVLIILRKDICVTVCNYETNMMIDFVSYQQKRNQGFTDAVDLVFRLFLSSSVWYLKRLKQMSSLIDEYKHKLDHKISNEDLIGLSRLHDSLTYFVTSIRGNETLLSKLKFKLPVDELDADLIEDVTIEMNQARETTNIYTNILDSTMETYASIINNNMSGVMKTMTSISIILMFPTLIASLYGMNLINGMENKWWGFPLVAGFSLAVAGVGYFLFRRKSWL